MDCSIEKTKVLNTTFFGKKMNITAFLEKYEHIGESSKLNVRRALESSNDKYLSDEERTIYREIKSIYSSVSPQKAAFEYKDEEKHQVSAKYTNFKFGSYKNIQSFEEAILNTPKEKRFYYEHITGGCKLYADIEKESHPSELLLAKRHLILDLIKELILKACEEYGIKCDDEHMKFLDSSAKKGDEDKLSFHFCLNGIYFAKAYDQQGFWKYIETLIFENDRYRDLIVLKKKNDTIEQTTMFDLSVYSKNRALRTIFSRKQKSGMERTLIPITWDETGIKKLVFGSFRLSDYFVTNIKDCVLSKGIAEPVEEWSVPKASEYRTIEEDEVLKIIEENVKDWTFSRIASNCYVLRKDSDDAICACDKKHSVQSESYVYLLNRDFVWKCHQSYKTKVIYTMPQKKLMDPTGEEWHYGTIRKMNHGTYTLDTIKQYCYSSFCKVDGVRRIAVMFKKVQCSMNFSNGTTIYYYKNVECESGKILCNYDDYKIRIKWTDECKYISHICTAFGVTPKDKALDIWPSPSETRRISLGRTLNHFISLQEVVKIYPNYTFYPIKGDRGNLFNTFAGFPFDGAIPKKIIDYEKTPMFDLINTTLSTEPTVSEYIHDYIAQMIQYPERKPDVALVFVSRPGCGKSLFCNFLNKILGNALSNIQEPDKLEKFNGDQVGKLLLVFEEPAKARVKINWEQIKHIVTRRRIQVRRMHKDKTSENAYERVIFCMNSIDSVVVSTYGRRLMISRCREKYVGRFAFFKALDEQLVDPDFLISAFQYYKTRDISGFEPRKYPETKAKQEAKMAQLPNPLKFLISVFEDIGHNTYSIFRKSELDYDGRRYKFGMQRLFDAYVEWCEQCRIKRILTRTVFKGVLIRNGFLYKKNMKCKTRSCSGFVFYASAMNEWHRKLIDEGKPLIDPFKKIEEEECEGTDDKASLMTTIPIASTERIVLKKHNETESMNGFDEDDFQCTIDEKYDTDESESIY